MLGGGGGMFDKRARTRGFDKDMVRKMKVCDWYVEMERNVGNTKSETPIHWPVISEQQDSFIFMLSELK